MQRSKWVSYSFLIPLGARTVLFLFFQALIALVFFALKQQQPFLASSAWWPLNVTFTNLVCLAALLAAYQKDGKRYWDIFIVKKRYVKTDLLVVVPMLFLLVPIAMVPNLFLSQALFGGIHIPMAILLQELPHWAILIVALCLFPLTQGLVELAFYFNYCMPSIRAKTKKPVLAYILCCVFLGLQHSMVPFFPDWRFVLWRSLMFMPFAFFVGAILAWKPRMLVYLAFIHMLMDISASVMYLTGL